MSAAEPLPALCSDCGKGKGHPNHGDGDECHFFNTGEALLGPRAVEPPAPTPAPVVPIAPPRPRAPSESRKTKDHRRCIICGQERTFHRGKIDHAFEPPVNATPTPAQILEAVDRALRSIRVAPRVKVGEVTIRPVYAADNDAELLSARVLIDLSLIFPGRAENP